MTRTTIHADYARVDRSQFPSASEPEARRREPFLGSRPDRPGWCAAVALGIQGLSRTDSHGKMRA